MKLFIYSVLSVSMIAGSVKAETTTPKKQYQEPTRGFFIEHGTVSGQGNVSVELHSGSNGLNSGGGIRLGLENSELIINNGLGANHGLGGNNGSAINAANSLTYKWALPDLNTSKENRNRDVSKQENSSKINWALLGGISQIDIDTPNNANDIHFTNLMLGVAVTVKADAATFTLSPRLVHANSSGNASDDTFVEAGLGGYVGLIDTTSGLFSLGLEANFTTQDNTDNQLALGGRWAYNERINIDIVPVILQDSDLMGVPGLVRLNVVF